MRNHNWRRLQSTLNKKYGRVLVIEALQNVGGELLSILLLDRQARLRPGSFLRHVELGFGVEALLRVVDAIGEECKILRGIGELV